MHGVGRIELSDRRTSVKPGSVPVYTGPFCLEYYEEKYPTDIYDWDYDWDDHELENECSYEPETKKENEKTSKWSKVKDFLATWWLQLFAILWTILLAIMLGGNSEKFGNHKTDFLVEIHYFTKGTGSETNCGNSPLDMCRYGSDCGYDEQTSTQSK